MFLRFVVDEAGSDERPPGSGFEKLSQNTAEAEEVSLLLLNLRLLADCDSRLKLEDPPGRKSMYDLVARNRVLLLLLPSENFSKFLSFNDDIELIFDIIFMLGVFCKLFRLSNECFEIRDECFSVDALGKNPTPSLVSFELPPLFGASSVKISDIFCVARG